MTQTIDHSTAPGWQAPPPPPPPMASRPWYKKRWVWAVSALAVIIIAASGSGSDKKTASNGRPLPAGSDQPAVTTAPTAPPATTAPTSAPVVKVTATTSRPTPTTVAQAVVPVVDSCDRVREALLTGTQPQINAAMAALQADKAADATGREYADYYLHRDAPPALGSKELRDMDVSLIRMACS